MCDVLRTTAADIKTNKSESRVLVLPASRPRFFTAFSFFGDATFFCRYTITTFRNIVQRGGRLPGLIAAPPVAVETFVDLLQVCACVYVGVPFIFPGPDQGVTDLAQQLLLINVRSTPWLEKKTGMVGIEPVSCGCSRHQNYLLKHRATV